MASSIVGSIRPLQYPLNTTLDIESDTPNDAIIHADLSGWTTTDNEERIDIVLNLSLDEYVALATSIDVGRDIAYGDNSLYIWWIWIRSLKSMSICASIIECIENDASVRNAIQNSVGGYDDVNGQAPRWGALAIEPVFGCDLDTTWGYSKALWDYINQRNKDFLQILAEAGNQQEQIAGMISAIPLFGLLPFDEIAEWLGKLGEYNLDAYNASITTEINEQIWCDLFCIAQNNNCSITFELVWDYMLDKFGGVNFPTLGATFLELVAFMITGTYLNDRIVYLWTLVQLGIAFIGATWLGQNTMNVYAIHAQNGDPDDDWILLCDECDIEWQYEWDFTTVDGVAEGWEISNNGFPPGGFWTDGVGYTTGSNPPFEALTLQNYTVATYEITQVETIGINTLGDNQFTQVKNSGSLIGSESGLLPHDIVFPSPQVANNIKIVLANLNSVPVVTSVKIYGVGTNPFE